MLGRGIDHASDIILSKAVAGKTVMNVHPALWAGGIAAVGQLNDQLAWQSIFAEHLKRLEKFHE
jgi:hypothetical protein